VFEVEKPKKWIVQTKDINIYGEPDYIVLADHDGNINPDLKRLRR
jgi:hypothetical protein